MVVSRVHVVMGHKHSLMVSWVRSEPQSNLRARSTLRRLLVMRMGDRYCRVMGDRVLRLRRGFLGGGRMMNRSLLMLRGFVWSAYNGMMNNMSLMRDRVLAVRVVQEWSLCGLGKSHGVIRVHNSGVVNRLGNFVLDDLSLLVHRESVMKVGSLWNCSVDFTWDLMGHWRNSVHWDGYVMNRSSRVHNSVGIDRMIVMVCSVVLSCWVSNVGRFGLVSDGSFHFSVVRISDDSLGCMGRSSVMHFMVKSMRVNHN